MDESEQTIKVYCNSGANIHSTHEREVYPQDLGFDSFEAWKGATDDEKYEAVADYWASMGYPEIYWEE